MRRLYELRETHPAGSLRKSTARLLALVFTLSLCFQQVWAAPEARTVIPLGKAVGIKLFADGALVVGLSEDGPCPARDCGLKEGDLILTMGDAKITSTEQVRQVLQDNGCEPLALTIRRGSRDLRVTAVPTQGADGAWQLGAWIRDSMAGIGTLTYYDPATGSYGALGHGITDVDTAQLMPLACGSIMETTVKAVKKGAKGDPGELKGDFSVQRDVGTVSVNSDGGIFGTVADPDFLRAGTPVPVATARQVKTGPATILTTISNDDTAEYTVQIVRVFSGSQSTRNLLLKVTDQRLLDATGGIVQGMVVSYNRDNSGEKPLRRKALRACRIGAPVRCRRGQYGTTPFLQTG